MRIVMTPARAGLFLLLLLALSLLAYAHATHNFNQQLRGYIQQRVLDQTDKAELYSFNDPATQRYLVQEMTRNLATLCDQKFPQMLSDCSAQVISFKGLNYADGSGSKATMDFYQGPDSAQPLASIPLVQVAVFYRVNWVYLLGTQGLLALLAWIAIALLPAPVSDARRVWVEALKRWDLSEKRALELTQSLTDYPITGAARLSDLWTIGQRTGTAITPEAAIALATNTRAMNLNAEQLPWLLRGLALYPQQLDAALAIAESPPQLIFNPLTKSVSVHGLNLPLADTPFFYFYWYALLRLTSHEGWYTNPAQTRPDLKNSQTFKALFEKYGGHAKAASELQDKGLRAKTLDQNRSKIKDELVRYLGEDLALPYLFDMQRDTRTARCKYRISLAPDAIQVAAEDLELANTHADSPPQPERAVQQ